MTEKIKVKAVDPVLPHVGDLEEILYKVEALYLLNDAFLGTIKQTGMPSEEGIESVRLLLSDQFSKVTRGLDGMISNIETEERRRYNDARQKAGDQAGA